MISSPIRTMVVRVRWPGERAEAEADQEPDPDLELDPQADLDHLVDRRVEPAISSAV